LKVTENENDYSVGSNSFLIIIIIMA